MFEIDWRSRIPIYEQIKEQVMQLIQLGVLHPHDQLPSIRSLAQELVLNVNTVKRAFSELEQDGVIYALPGRGNFISEDAFSNQRIKEDALREIRQALLSGKAKGVSKEEIRELLGRLYPD